MAKMRRSFSPPRMTEECQGRNRKELGMVMSTSRKINRGFTQQEPCGSPKFSRKPINTFFEKEEIPLKAGGMKRLVVNQHSQRILWKEHL